MLAETIKAEGLNLVSGGTDNHLMLVDLRPAKLTGKEMEHRLDEVCITVNKNAIPNDPEKPFVTSRGFKEDDMKIVGKLIAQTAFHFDTKAEEIKAAAMALTAKYPIYNG